jgi:2-polyprenyl-3-methyl-5-hydroxy-6-metoxy-1,4-benzoquinol methylase
MSSSSRLRNVRTFFEEPQNYFHKDFHVEVRADIVREMLPQVQGVEILDIGCGDGRVSLQFLPQAGHVTLLDMSENMLLRARANVPAEYVHKTTFLTADFMDCKPATPSDVVICLGVLAHVERAESAIQKLASLTRVGGRCIVQISDSERALGRLQYLASQSHFGRRTVRKYRLQRTRFGEIQRMASAAGLRFILRKDHCLLLPGMGRLPNHWLLSYDRFVLNSRFLQRFASSSVLLFERLERPCVASTTK